MMFVNSEHNFYKLRKSQFVVKSIKYLEEAVLFKQTIYVIHITIQTKGAEHDLSHHQPANIIFLK